jgi:hypothetical protein
MRRIIEGSFVMCALDDQAQQTAQPAAGQTGQQPAQDGARRRRNERVVTCTAVRNGQEFNVGRRMVEEGYAAAQGEDFTREAQEALTRTRGLAAWCTLRPDIWMRRSTAEKNAFRDRGMYQRDWATFGTCPPPPRTPSGQRDMPERSAPE